MEFSEEELKQIFKIFKDESEEHLGNINRCLLELEKKPDDAELIAELFREAHSVKGSARMLDVLSIQDLAHKMEDLLGLAKDKTIIISPEIIDILCRGVDNILKILNIIEYNTLDYIDENSNKLIQEIDELKKSLTVNQNQTNDISALSDSTDNPVNTDKTDFVINKFENNKHNNSQNMLADDAANFGILKHYLEQINNKFSKSTAINELVTLLKSLIDKKENDDKTILQIVYDNLVFISENDMLATSEMIEAMKQALEVVLVSSKNVDMQLIIQRQNIIKQMLELSKENDKIFNVPDRVQANEIKTHNDNFKKSQSINKDAYDIGAIKTLRVDTKKLDRLESQVEELIVLKINNKQYLNSLNTLLSEFQDLQKHLNRIMSNSKILERKYQESNLLNDNTYSFKSLNSQADKLNDSVDKIYAEIDAFQKKFLNDDMRLNFLTDEIENVVRSVRILPLATVFHMFPRMVRDIARAQGKQVDIIITGSETSADKTIVEEIKAPLIHVIRNSVDHGIETPEERIQSGKNPTGKILLNSYQSGNAITVEVIDDGRGLSVEKIKEKVLRQNLMSEDELSKLSESQIMNLIFWPGFSTQDTVTDISGRGIGLDVVHTKIAQLEGKVSIQSQEGSGFKLVIKIPITLATLKALLVKINGQIFAISSAFVKTVTFVNDNEILSKEGKPHIIYNNSSIKLVKLSELLNINYDKHSSKHNVVVVNIEDTMLAIEVDEFLRTEEILQKKLNPPLTRVKNISGVSSLSTGESCLILNMNDIIKSALSYRELSTNRTILSLPDNKQKVYKILIVDDSKTTITLEKNILKTAGFDVVTASNGSEGLNRLSYAKVDVIVTDLEMPVMGGVEFIKNIRKKDKITPIIVLSALRDDEIQKLCEDLGANDYIIKKDFSEKTFLTKINMHL